MVVAIIIIFILIAVILFLIVILIKDRYKRKITTFSYKDLMRFLENADDAYIKAFQFKYLGDFSKYATNEVNRFLQKQILYYNNKLWGTKNYRIRHWTVVSSKSNEIIVRKELKFKNIKFGHTMISMGDNCVEYWRIFIINNNFKVGDITC